MRAVFLDRDGVLNRAILRGEVSSPPASLEELHILPGVLDACRKLRAAGFRLIVVTNQPDVSRGSMCLEVVEAINEAMMTQLPLDDIRVCYHDDHDRCECRKPAPGLLLRAAADWALDLSESFMVGDRWKDIEAGKRAGCRTVLIADGNAPVEGLSPDHSANSLIEAAVWILGQSSGRVDEGN
jgi:D-glycero-D-manno-heptose 1,7-bisphosphate phosphatase